MHKTTLALGPILGIEGDQNYSVVVLLKDPVDPSQLSLFVHDGNRSTLRIKPDRQPEKTPNYYCWRFSFEVPLDEETREIVYTLGVGDSRLVDAQNDDMWEFIVPGHAIVPKIGFASCNGDSKHMPSKLRREKFVMWRKLLTEHRRQDSGPFDFAFHALLLVGDQVYADPMWTSVPYLAKRRFIRWRRSRFVRHHQFSSDGSKTFGQQLELFYEQLYVDTFGQPDISAVLARIPSCMIWDDHDIVDGWGSYPSDIQESEIFKAIFGVAKRYFQIFQMRTDKNRSHMQTGDFSQHFRFRNYEIFLLDNRTHRTPNQVMADTQYDALEKYQTHKLFNGADPALLEEQVLMFVVPAPIAHLNYKAMAENIVSRLLKFQIANVDFTNSIADDITDHWSHGNHVSEQKRFIDMVYAIADSNKVKYVHLISGDVHSAGSGRLTRTNGLTTHVNQLVSSPIAYKPPGKFLRWALARLSEKETQIEGYDILVHRVENNGRMPSIIYERNFGYLYKANQQGLKFYLKLETGNEYQWGQPKKYAPD